MRNSGWEGGGSYGFWDRIRDERRAEKPLRLIDKIERDPTRPGWARLTLACGHSEEVENFPDKQPPPCFRRICPVEGCANA